MNWQEILTSCGVAPNRVRQWAGIFAQEVRPDRFSRGAEEIDDWLGQVLHESGMLGFVEESLTYTTPERIRATWPTRFPTLEAAQPYVRNAEALANLVYGGRMGNTQPGDGWRFRGRGLIQVTGRDNYRALGRAMNLPLEEEPQLLLLPNHAVRGSIVWWERNVPDSAINNLLAVTRRVNGGTVGLDHRRKATDAADRADGRTDGALA